MSAVSYEDDGRDHAQGMIDWLRGQSPDVWHDAASNLNWDNAERVLDWVVSQPNCDKATAARIFWAANPLYYMRALATAEWRSEQHLRLVTKIIRNWKSGFYKRADLVWREDHRVDYRLTRENLGGSDPLAIPPPGGVQFPGYTTLNPSDYESYFQAVTSALNSAAPGTFSPSLETLDALIESITVSTP